MYRIYFDKYSATPWCIERYNYTYKFWYSVSNWYFSRGNLWRYFGARNFTKEQFDSLPIVGR